MGYHSNNFPFGLDELPQPAYLVGGWVRDRLLGRTKKHLDLDFVLPTQAVETARSIAHRHKAGFVVLDRERQIARVVFANATADFALQMGDTLEIDLGRRDFWMNSIAIDCQSISSTGEFSERDSIDPGNGKQDLAQKLVRMVAPENLQDDPLRILRAYRQAAQLGFEIEPVTRQVLIKLAKGLKNIAAERVRTELAYLLSAPDRSKWMQHAVDDGILRDWLPSQHLQLSRLGQMDASIDLLVSKWSELAAYFAKEISSDRSVGMTTKLAAMVSSATALESLGFSRAEQRFCVELLRHLPKFLTFLVDRPDRIQQYQLFQSTLTSFPALVALALASGADLDAVTPWLAAWLDPHDSIAHPPTLITGDDLKTELNLPPSPRIGELLHDVRLAQIDGVVYDRESSIDYAKSKL